MNKDETPKESCRMQQRQGIVLLLRFHWKGVHVPTAFCTFFFQLNTHLTGSFDKKYAQGIKNSLDSLKQHDVKAVVDCVSI